MHAEREGQAPAGIQPVNPELVGLLGAPDSRLAPNAPMTGRPAAITLPPTSASLVAIRAVSGSGLS